MAAIRFIVPGQRKAARDLGLECKFYSKLNVSGITRVLHAAEIRAISDSSIRIQELGAIEDVKKL